MWWCIRVYERMSIYIYILYYIVYNNVCRYGICSMYCMAQYGICIIYNSVYISMSDM